MEKILSWKVATLILLIMLIVVFFYWWEFLPRQIRVKCNERASLDTAGYAASVKNITDDEFNKLYNQSYQRCLRGNGLEE